MKIFVPSYFDVNEVSTHILKRATRTLDGAKDIAQNQADERAGMASIEPMTLTWKLEFDPSEGEQRWQADCGDTTFYVDELEFDLHRLT